MTISRLVKKNSFKIFWDRFGSSCLLLVRLLARKPRLSGAGASTRSRVGWEQDVIVGRVYFFGLLLGGLETRRSVLG